MAEARAKTKPASATRAAFDWADPFDLESQFTEEERQVRDTARAYARDKLMPRVIKAYREEKYDREVVNEMGRLGLLGVTIPEEYRRRRPELRLLRPCRARDRGRRLRLPLDDERAVVARHVSDLGLRRRCAAQEVSAEARQRRMGRLLWFDRAGLRLRSGRHAHARREDEERLQADRHEALDHERADRRRVCRLGEIGGAWRRDPRLHPRARGEGSVDAEDRRASSACAPPSPARSRWTASRCRRKRCFPTCPA